MELRHLRYFLAVAEELNFTRAAEKIHLAQPSLTRQIKNLEDELGVQLFNRTKTQVTLTEEGLRFLVDAKRLVSMSLESIQSIQRFGRGETKHLNVGYMFKFNFDLLPATLRTFYHKSPETPVNLFDMTPAEQLVALEAGKIDLGFMGLRPTTAGKNRAALAWECVAHHDVVVVLPEFHPLAKKKKVNIADLRHLFFVAMSEETHPGSRDWLSGICREAGFTPRILQDVELESGIMTFVAEGLGVTLARSKIRKLPHVGVVFRPLASDAKAEHWIASRLDNRSKALAQYIEIVKETAPEWR